MKITAISGAAKTMGQLMFPHKHRNGKFAVQKTNLARDKIELDTIPELVPYLQKGYRVRMSVPGPNNPTSLMAIASLDIVGGSEAEDRSDEESELDELVIDDDLDGERRAKYRKEQHLLRQILLKKYGPSCVICGDSMSDDLLVAAHIKRRSACTTSERKDYYNIAGLMCRLGCDSLFELGYVGVHDGAVVELKTSESSIVRKSVERIIARDIKNWNVSKKYYKWHCKYHTDDLDASRTES